MRYSKFWMILLSLLLACAMLVNLTGCAIQTVHGEDLMNDIKAGSVNGKDADDVFLDSQMRLSVALFQACVRESKNQNVLISPLSIQLALAMTANGAKGETKEEMEQLLGGEIPLETLNEYLYSYISGLPSKKKESLLKIANSIWFRDEEERLTVEEDFLQTNADYYGAQAYKCAFDHRTLKDINNWVKKNTDGMIDEILDEIKEDAVMYLINALVFDAEWETVYNKNDIFSGTFTSIDGTKQEAEMMSSSENRYMDDGKATGFIKNYKGANYSFAALLPNEGIDIYNYIENLSVEKLRNTIKNAKSGTVMVQIPKFSYEYGLEMEDVLKELGMQAAFDEEVADFSGIGHSKDGNLFIGSVLHKTFISVDELGTKAGAVTKVEITNESAPFSEWIVHLDRPFVYMILDNASGLPVFIGVVTDLG